MANKLAVIVLVVVLLLLASTAGGYFYMSSVFGQAIQVKREQIVEVKKGETLNQICARLQSKQYISNCVVVKLYSKLFDTYTDIKAGSYETTPGQTLSELLLNLVDGNVKQYSFTIVEGENVFQVLDKLASAPRLKNDLKDLNMKQVASALGLTQESAEGWLSPETYLYPASSLASDLLKRAVKVQQGLLQSQWQKRAKNLPLKSAYEALILASIIEKESSVAAERNKVSSVFHNRLNKNMRLQTDPTVIYGVWHEYKGDITRKHLRTKTPYNTYRINGLTPTPIANPSLASINATLHPSKTDYLYFVASGNGDHIFSESLDAHNRAVRNYLRKQRINKLKDNNG